MMEKNTIVSELDARFGEGIVESDGTSDILTVTAEKEMIHQVLEYLVGQKGFMFLTDLCGIHDPSLALPLGVIYHLHDFYSRTRIRVKTFLPVDEPEVPTVTDLFAAANWMERETYDFYGIIFKGHPNLKRILNVEYMDYFPLRKEYPLEDPTREDKDDRFFGR